jgi:hypothetical protein
MEDRVSKPFQKRYPLESGDEVTVRPMGVFDFAVLAQIPELLDPDTVLRPPDEGEEPNEPRLPSKLSLERLKIMLTKGVVAYHFRTPGDDTATESVFIDFKVVEKDPPDCENGEISYIAIPDLVQTELVKFISRASGVPDTGQFLDGDQGGGGSGHDEPEPGDLSEPSSGDGSSDVQPEQEDPGEVPGDPGHEA